MTSDLLEDPIKVLADLTAAFLNLNIPYLIGGSFASSIYGELRATQDLDILCDLRNQSLDLFVKELESSFYVDDIALKQAVKDYRSINIFHRSTAFKVDLFTKIGDFEEEQLLRANVIKLYDSKLELSMASAEDTVLAKLRWYKMGNCTSERQWRDLCGVIRISKDSLDMKYLTTWANKLALSHLLEQLVLTSNITSEESQG